MTINQLTKNKNFPWKCDIFIHRIFSYTLNIITIRAPKNHKIMKTSIKSTENNFTADKKSTMISPQSPKTRYWLTSFILNHKKINIDQL